MGLPKFIKHWWTANTQLMFRTKGTVILKIWSQILFGILYSTVVVCIHLYIPGMEMHFPLTLVTILGVVIGLLLVFRTNTAYDRYYEGRRTWSTMTQNIRLLTQSFWLGVRDTGSSNDFIEKISAINLVVAFAYATKNYLREEYSYDDDEVLRELTSHIPKFQRQTALFKFNPSSSSIVKKHDENNDSPKSHVPKRQVSINLDGKDDSDTGNKKSLRSDRLTRQVSINMEDMEDSNNGHRDGRESSLASSRAISMSTRRRSAEAKLSEGNEGFTRRDNIYMAHDFVKPSNIPLELAYYIASYIYGVMRREIVDPNSTRIMLESLNRLMDCLTQFERILRTPIPLAYSVHLHQSVWLYLLSLPFQLVGTLEWFTVPVIALAVFALLGILAIGWEIENPFGYDDNDLPLDDYCEVIRQEVLMIISHQMAKPEEWTFSPDNHPFIPKSSQTASSLTEKTVDQLRDILAKGFYNESFVNDE